jgi:aspartate racemase
MVLIRAVKTGTQKALGDAGLQRAADALVDAGADALLIACTELSALGAGPSVPIPVFDAADLLAQAVVDHARERTQT